MILAWAGKRNKEMIKYIKKQPPWLCQTWKSLFIVKEKVAANRIICLPTTDGQDT